MLAFSGDAVTQPIAATAIANATNTSAVKGTLPTSTPIDDPRRKAKQHAHTESVHGH
uniref:Uncharacterized protein MLCB4.09c n=1 Tax=Mycobacterium leprae TaxID=1769 RepID=O69586_MYCLR|nr:hypothetical protein MLCB4.09c [Mycobacterium leprae]